MYQPPLFYKQKIQKGRPAQGQFRNHLFAFLPCPGGKTSRTDGEQLQNNDTPAHFLLQSSRKKFWQKYASSS